MGRPTSRGIARHWPRVPRGPTRPGSRGRPRFGWDNGWHSSPYDLSFFDRQDACPTVDGGVGLLVRYPACAGGYSTTAHGAFCDPDIVASMLHVTVPLSSGFMLNLDHVKEMC